MVILCPRQQYFGGAEAWRARVNAMFHRPLVKAEGEVLRSQDRPSAALTLQPIAEKPLILGSRTVLSIWRAAFDLSRTLYS